MEERARTETAFHVVADEHELGDPALLETGKDVAADPHPLPLEGVDRRRQDPAIKRLPLLQWQLEIVERDLAHPSIARGNRRGLHRDHRRCSARCFFLRPIARGGRSRLPSPRGRALRWRDPRFRRRAADRDGDQQEGEGPPPTGVAVSGHWHPPGDRTPRRRHRRPRQDGSRTGRRSSAGAACTRSSACRPSARAPGR